MFRQSSRESTVLGDRERGIIYVQGDRDHLPSGVGDGEGGGGFEDTVDFPVDFTSVFEDTVLFVVVFIDAVLRLEPRVGDETPGPVV